MVTNSRLFSSIAKLTTVNSSFGSSTTMQQHQEQYFISCNNAGENQLNLLNMMSTRPMQTRSTPMFTSKTAGVGIINSVQPKAPVPVTPTSTPPIRFNQSSRRQDDVISPSPLTTKAQQRYYEDSTWRMYDRIQASRPTQQGVSSRSSMSSLPRYPPKHLHEPPLGGSATADFAPSGGDEDNELIFDLEL